MRRVFNHVKTSGTCLYMHGSKAPVKVGDIIEFRFPDGSLSRLTITKSNNGCIGCHFNGKYKCPVHASRSKELGFKSKRVGTRYVYLLDRYFCSSSGTNTILISIDDIMEDI